MKSSPIAAYKIDELKAMGISELLPLMPARARRKIVRGFSRGEETLLTKVREGDEKIRTHLREMIVMPEMVGKIDRDLQRQGIHES